MDLPYVCSVGDNEIRRDEGFRIPLTGTELVAKKDKDKRKAAKKKKKPSKKKAAKAEEPKKKKVAKKKK